MPPITTLIKPVSNLCNMRCRYCFYSDVVKHRETPSYGIMSPETLETLVRKALFVAEGACAFGFQGGEPTLAGIEFYKNLISLQEKYANNGIAISNSIQTNGYELGTEWAKFFAKHNFLVGLSIDGTSNIHNKFRKNAEGSGTYAEVEKTADMFKKYDVQYNILCVVNNDIACTPRETYESLKKHKFLQFIPCLNSFDNLAEDFSLNPENYGRFLKLTFDMYYRDFMNGKYVSVRNFDNYISILMGGQAEQCGMMGVCGEYFLVEADGSVFPCDFYVLDEWKLGNIIDDSFVRLQRRRGKFVELSKKMHADCIECKWRGLCHGGCRRYRENDGISLNVLCGAYKSFFEYAYTGMIEICKNLIARKKS